MDPAPDQQEDNDRLTQLTSGICRRDGSPLDRGTGLSRSGVKKACTGLIERGLLIRSRNTRPDGREAEESTYRLNLFASLPETEEGVGHEKAYPGHEETGGRPRGGPEVGHTVAPQETEQETEQETAVGKPVADAALVSSLVGKGVGQSVAVQLAREKPDECRRYLDWLPFAEVKTTEGAWLVNAIRDGYGPPKAIAKRQAEERRRVEETTAANRTGPPSSQDRRGEKKGERLRETYSQLLRTQPDAITAFESYLTSERERAEKTAAKLSERRRAEYRREADSEEYRLTHFERWLRREGKGLKPLGTERDSHLAA